VWAVSKVRPKLLKAGHCIAFQRKAAVQFMFFLPAIIFLNPHTTHVLGYEVQIVA
jgi:hypothetical protein